MGTLIRLNETTIEGVDLPTLSDYGHMPADGLVDMFKMKTDFDATNDATGGAMTNQSSTTGGNVASWSGGITTLPDTSGANEYHMYRLNGLDTGLARTFLALFKVPDKSRTQTVFQPIGGGATLQLGDHVTVNFNDGGNQNVDMATHSAGVWQSVVMATDSNGVRLILNTGEIQTIVWSDYTAPPADPTGETRFGRNSTSFTPYGEFALIGQHSRALSNQELSSAAKGLETFATGVKGLTIGAA